MSFARIGKEIKIDIYLWFQFLIPVIAELLKLKLRG